MTNRYISIRFDKLSPLASSSSQTSDPGPRTCSANGCEITYQTLVNEGLSASGNIAGRYIQPTSIATAGDTCSPNGRIRKALNGSPVWCVDGVWKGNEGNTIVSSGSINNNSTFACRSGASGKILVHAYANWLVGWGVYWMNASFYANGVLVETDRTAAFEYDHGRASGSSVTLFHTVETSSGSDYTFSVAATSDNLVKVSYSCVGV